MDEILLLLTQDGFDIGELRARENGDEDFHRNFLAGFPVDNVQTIPGKINVHSVPRLVFQVSDRGRLNKVGLEDSVELAVFVAFREFLQIKQIDLVLGHAFLPQHPGIFRHPFHGFQISVRLRKGWSSVRLFIEETEQIGFFHCQDFLDALAALVEGVDVLFHGGS